MRRRPSIRERRAVPAAAVCKSLDAGLFYLASLLAVPPRDEAVVECGGGGQHVVGIGRHEGGREGGCVA